MSVWTDTFTEAVETALTAHTPDSGGTWTERERTGTAAAAIVAHVNDRCRPSDSAVTGSVRTLYTVDWAPAGAEYDITFTTPAFSTSAGVPIWIIARYTATDSFYAVGIYPSGAAVDVKIVKVTSGPTRTLLASANVDPVAGDSWKFEVRNATKKLYRNGAEVLSTDDNAITGAGVVGLGIGNIGDVSTNAVHFQAEIDAFSLDDAASAAPGGLSWCPVVAVSLGVLPVAVVPSGFTPPDGG